MTNLDELQNIAVQLSGLQAKIDAAIKGATPEQPAEGEIIDAEIQPAWADAKKVIDADGDTWSRQDDGQWHCEGLHPRDAASIERQYGPCEPVESEQPDQMPAWADATIVRDKDGDFWEPVYDPEHPGAEWQMLSSDGDYKLAPHMLQECHGPITAYEPRPEQPAEIPAGDVVLGALVRHAMALRGDSRSEAAAAERAVAASINAYLEQTIGATPAADTTKEQK